MVAETAQPEEWAATAAPNPVAPPVAAVAVGAVVAAAVVVVLAEALAARP